MIECFARTLPEQLYNFPFWEVLVIFYCEDIQILLKNLASLSSLGKCIRNDCNTCIYMICRVMIVIFCQKMDIPCVDRGRTPE